jgi:signal transduction histidine kinase/CheY-like chemotaxis protein
MTRATGPFPFPALPVPARHIAALSAVVFVFLLSRSASQLIDDGGLFLLLSVAILGSAWFAGTGNALAGTVLGAILGSAAGHDRSRGVEMHLALFVIQGLLMTALVAELRRARRTAEHEARIAHASQLEGEAASRMKDEFLATISHELRTPLNAVLGWMQLIRTGKLDDVTRHRGLDAIERNVRLQTQLTTDLLDVSKALTGNLRIDLRRLSLDSVIGEAISQAAPAAAAKDVMLRVTNAEPRLVVRGDPNRLRQVVWHLLANAIKFTPRRGTVEIAVAAADVVSVSVSDTGPGIKREFLSRLFERFSQADASPTRVSGGLGVGLSLVREIVERHGGEIDARNRDGGTGAVFTVRLPLHFEDQRLDVPHAAAPALAAAGAPLDGVRVLLLDRDNDARELLTVLLQQRGAAVRATASVDDALEMLESWRPDILISDAAAPDRDAYAVVGKVQSLEAERGGRIPALALTHFAQTDEHMRQMLSDVQRDIPKPVEPAVLTAAIARLTGRERRQATR